MTPSSHLAMETNPGYPAFRAAVPGQKSFACWTLLTAIHATGNATNKLARTHQLFNSKQGDRTLPSYLQRLSDEIDQFKSDFGTPTDPELVYIH